MANNNDEPISADELKRLGDALKDDKFRQLLLEYADEIRDPQRRLKYEQELSMLERERGVDLTFIHPEAGYVIKTSSKDGAKTFVNICKNRNVAKPSCSRSKVKAGLDWSVPYFLSPSRDDTDKSGRKCRIFDVVFHPDTIYMSQRNARFRKMIEDTALDGIQHKFSVPLDRKNVNYPKLKYKGHPFPTVLRKPVVDSSVTELSEHLENTTLSCQEYPYTPKNTNDPKTLLKEKLLNGVVLEPKYSIRYRNNIDMKNFTVLAQQSANLRPDEIVIEIQLPLLDSAKEIDVDVIQQTLVLRSTGSENYNLDLVLPHPVDNEEGKAQFDQTRHTLTVTLPIKPFEAFENKECKEEELATIENEKFAAVNLDDSFIRTHHCTMGNLCLPSHAYDLPAFNVNQSTEEVTFLFHVAKVHVDSIETQMCECGHGFQVVFTSVEDKNWYSFCLVSLNCIDMKDLEVDISGSNVILRASKTDTKEWTSFEYGCYEAVGYSYAFVNMPNVLEKFKKLKDGTQNFANQAIPVGNENVQVKDVTADTLQLRIMLSATSHLSSEADTEEDTNDNCITEVPRKCRTSSESSLELCPLPSRRGILKYPRNWRSISESSDDLNCCSPLDMLPPSPEEDEDFPSSDKLPKKNVRFSEHVAKNIFRANSSILRQKKKNQKRAQNKKRVAAQRSSSQEESESHESTGTTEEDSEQPHSHVIQLEKPKKKKCRSKIISNGYFEKSGQNRIVSTDQIVDLLVDKSNEEAGLMTNCKMEGTGEPTATIQINNEMNKEYKNTQCIIPTEIVSSAEQNLMAEKNSSVHTKDSSTLLVMENCVDVESQNQEVLPAEIHSFPCNKDLSIESSTDDTFHDNQGSLIKTEKSVSNQSDGEFKNVGVNKKLLDNNEADCEEDIRTCSEMLFDLDFRTNSEGLLEISLPPDNTAFHLD